jgi:protease IV
MDFEQTDLNATSKAPQQPPQITYPPVQKRKSGWRIFFGIILAFSLLANFVLFMIIIAVALFSSAGQQKGFSEELIKAGDKSNKIAVIDLKGIIMDDMAEEITKQFKIASKDSSIKAVIVKINSPGGTVSASDQIYHEIKNYRKNSGKPVLAFMEGMAASGGYYSSVACDKIIAEPTTITGSIGVIMSYLVLQDLLNQKLGIMPVTIKSGEKKDWPSAFHAPTEEQLKYIEDKLIQPAYKRFVQLVADGRPELETDEVFRLADGSIYYASEAKDLKLIDQIGYIDDAIQLASSMAKITKPHVIEYKKVFSFSDIFASNAKTSIKIDRATIYEFTNPQILYMWNPIN